MIWRAWYEDGSVYTSSDTTWAMLPGEGMVGVVVYLSTTTTPYRRIVDGSDWYWMEDGRVHTTGTIWRGYVDPPKVKCAACLKRSGVMDDDAWAEVQREMMAAREAPR